MKCDPPESRLRCDLLPNPPDQKVIELRHTEKGGNALVVDGAKYPHGIVIKQVGYSGSHVERPQQIRQEGHHME